MPQTHRGMRSEELANKTALKKEERAQEGRREIRKAGGGGVR